MVVGHRELRITKMVLLRSCLWHWKPRNKVPSSPRGADFANIREVDLHSKTVKTVAGTWYTSSSQKPSLVDCHGWYSLSSTTIASSSVCWFYGLHQFWKYDIASGAAYSLSGNGEELNQNGNSQNTTWAQPSGLALDGTINTNAISQTSCLTSWHRRSIVCCRQREQQHQETRFGQTTYPIVVSYPISENEQ